MSSSNARSRPDPRDIDRAAIDAAAARVAPFVTRTPVLTAPALDRWVGASVFVKAEHRQRTGSFKYRGATNAVQSLPEAEARRGVAAHSSGNHAAALALAARTRGVPAYVVMPENAPAAKRAAVEHLGAVVTWCAPTLAARRAALAQVLAETGAVELHPFEDGDVVAGAGTAARELVEDVPDLDVVVTPIGGGGLCSGTCIAVAPRRVVGAVPAAGARTIADGLRTGTTAVTDAVLDAHRVRRVLVDDAAIESAMHAVYEHTGERIEPSAAAAFAAARIAGVRGARVGIVCSGGNTDLAPLRVVS
jgi:threonine dehydratase/serine racemase